MELDNISSILITGATGSFGRAFLEKILNQKNNIKRIVIYSRDELKQWELQQKYPEKEYPQIRFFLGDIRDLERLKIAFKGIDTVIHAAALKQVPAAEYNPMEFIKTNVIGSQNIIDASIYNDVKRVIALSTDKAAAPINLYGASKLCSDKLFIAANNIKGSSEMRFSVVRYGNVMGSRGSVIPYFINQSKKGIIPITDPKMTRFNITLEEGVNLVLNVLKNAYGGEIFVPKIPSYRILDLVDAICPKCKKQFIGIRPGEKIHEEMITSSDSFNTYDNGDKYIIFPSDDKFMENYTRDNISLKKVSEGFSYNSKNNPSFLSINQIKDLIHKNVNKGDI